MTKEVKNLKEVKRDKEIRVIHQAVVDDEDSNRKKRVSIIQGSSQLTIRIPHKFVNRANINPNTDTFEFILVHLKEGENKFTLEGRLIKR